MPDDEKDAVMACHEFRPDHNGECLNCDEWMDAHTPEAVAAGKQAARPHTKLAADCWRMIRVLGGSRTDGKDDDAAAEHLIEMACDSAVEADRQKRPK